MKKESNKIKLCVLDLAGTTIQDPGNVLKYISEVLQEHSIPASNAEINAVMGIEKKHAIDLLLKDKIENEIDRAKLVQTLLRKFNLRMKNYYSEEAQAVSFAEEGFELLKSNKIKIALNTGFGKSITNAIIKKLHWQKKVNMIVSSEEVAQGRPHSDMIKKIKSHLGVTFNKQIAKIGDTPSDLLEGYNAHCQLNIGIINNAFPKKVLIKYPHTHLEPNLEKAILRVLQYHISPTHYMINF